MEETDGGEAGRKKDRLRWPDEPGAVKRADETSETNRTDTAGRPDRSTASTGNTVNAASTANAASMEKRRNFIINFLYFSLLVALSCFIIKYGLPMLAPFVIAFLVAWLLRGPIGFLSKRLRLPGKAAAILAVLLFYSTIGLLISLLGLRAFSVLTTLIVNLPALYESHLEPLLMGAFTELERLFLTMDRSFAMTLQELWGEMLRSTGQMISGLSVGAVGAASGLASALPGLFIKLLVLIISTFFIAMDYERLTGFCMRQLSGKSRNLFLQIKEYVVGTLFVCIRSYALIMSVTFVELSLGLTVIGVERAVLVAFLISLFDILPVLGTGGIMIPWMILTALRGEYPLALGLLAVYLMVTVIRNILEPRIVGSQIGLHPVVTLAAMFVGAQLFGVLGLFGFPILLSLFCHLNRNGTLKMLKLSEDGQGRSTGQSPLP